MDSISEASSRSLADVEDIVEEEEEEEDEVDDVVDGDRQSSQLQPPAAAVGTAGEGEATQVAAVAPPEAAAKLPFVEMAGRRWTDGGYSYGFDSRTRRVDDVTARVRINEPHTSPPINGFG